MKRVLFLSAFIFSLFSCKESEDSRVISDLEGKISHLESQLNKASVVAPGKLAHVVYLNLKEEISKKEQLELIKAVRELEKIEVVKELHLGKIADTGDTRFISDHELMFQITVDKKEDLDVYQKDSIHLSLKAIAKELLSEPPAVYDYWVF